MTTKQSLGHYILVDPADVPSLSDIEVAAEFMDFGAKLYTSMPSTKSPDPVVLARMGQFLRAFAEQNRKIIKKVKKET